MSFMSNTKVREAEMATLHRSERRDVRYGLPFEIEVMGIDGEGKVSHQRALTRNVSRCGCNFLSSAELRKARCAHRRTDSASSAGHKRSER